MALRAESLRGNKRTTRELIEDYYPEMLENILYRLEYLIKLQEQAIAASNPAANNVATPKQKEK